MNDLRARIAAIVERDRSREGRARGGVDRGTPRDGEPAARPGGPRRDERVSVDRAHQADPVGWQPFTVVEKRIDVGDLGLEVVARGAVDPMVAAHLGLKGEPPERWEDVLFLDTETTGLSGGTGTYVFLIGIAHFTDGELILRQHLLHDIGAESAFIAALQAEIEPFRACASYNGKSFDLPILRTRFVMTLRSDITVDDTHLDLLHPARRLWKDRFGSTTLKQLEESVLDDGRVADIPGSLIPDAYFFYLRKHDPAIIAPVLDHNARDVISLVRITDRVARAVVAARSGRAPDHAPAAFALARIFERNGENDAAYACYESAYYDGDNALRARVALPFARQLERRGECERAVRLLETLLALDVGTDAWRLQLDSRLRRLSKKVLRARLRPAS